jgi:hypothetical protein
MSHIGNLFELNWQKLEKQQMLNCLKVFLVDAGIEEKFA